MLAGMGADAATRITAQLIDAATNFHLWSNRFDRELKDIFAVQSEITDEILRAPARDHRADDASAPRRRAAVTLAPRSWSEIGHST